MVIDQLWSHNWLTRVDRCFRTKTKWNSEGWPRGPSFLPVKSRFGDVMAEIVYQLWMMLCCKVVCNAWHHSHANKGIWQQLKLQNIIWWWWYWLHLVSTINKSQHLVSTTHYFPEIYQGKIWSLSCVFYQCVISHSFVHFKIEWEHW